MDNTRNVERQQRNKQCAFLDDCGVWQSCGPVCKRNFVVRDGHLTLVKEVGGKFCVRTSADGKRTYVDTVTAAASR